MPFLLLANKRGTGGGGVSPRFPNGYLKQYEITIPSTSVVGTTDLTDFTFQFSETLNELRVTGSGGFVESGANGYDLRFELSTGQHLRHRIIYYNGTTGRTVARVLLPTVTVSADTKFFLYVGKPGLSTFDTAAGSPFPDEVAVYPLSSANDLLGSYNLTNTGMVSFTADGSPTGPFATFSGANILTHSTFAELADTPTYYISFYYKADLIGTDHGMVAIGGNVGGTSPKVDFVARFEDVSNNQESGVTNLIATASKFSTAVTEPAPLPFLKMGFSQAEGGNISLLNDFSNWVSQRMFVGTTFIGSPYHGSGGTGLSGFLSSPALSTDGSTAKLYANGQFASIAMPPFAAGDGAGQTGWAKAANGDFDSWHQKFADRLATIAGSNPCWVRLAHEVDQGRTWSLVNNGGSDVQASTFKDGWARLAAIYTARGLIPTLNFLKNPTVPLLNFWPNGVKNVSVDVYDNGSGGYATSETSSGWLNCLGSHNTGTGEIKGLEGARLQALALGVTWSVDEWGPANHSHLATDGANNDFFTARMAQYYLDNISDGKCAYFAYFTGSDHQVYPRVAYNGLASDAFLGAWSALCVDSPICTRTPVTPPPSPIWDGDYTRLPATGDSFSRLGLNWGPVGGTVRNATTGTIASVMAAANPGDTVVLAAGSYGAFTWTKSGTSTNPIMVKAQTRAFNGELGSGRAFTADGNRAKFNSGLNINASNVIFDGLYFGDTATNGIDIQSNQTRVRVQYCHFYDNINTGLLFSSETSNYDYCEVRRNCFEGVTQTPEGGGIGTHKMDYGIRQHGGKVAVLYEFNLITGYFNQGMSLKQLWDDTVVANNVWETQRAGMIAGETPDDDGLDKTGKRTLIVRNTFNDTPALAPLYIQNAQDTWVLENVFQGTNDIWIKPAAPDDASEQHNGVNHPRDTYIRRNTLNNITVRAHGRGGGPTRETVYFQDNNGGTLVTGSFNESNYTGLFSTAAPTIVRDPADYVKVATSIGKTRPASDITTPTVNETDQTQFTVGANKTVNLGGQDVHHHPPKFRVFRMQNCGNNAVLRGFTTIGDQNNNTTSWFQMKANAGLNNPAGTGEVGLDYDDDTVFISSGGSTIILEDFFAHGPMDGPNPDTSPAHSFHIQRKFYGRYCRDDWTELDAGQDVEIEDCLLECIHTWISSSGTSGSRLTARNCLVHCGRNPYTTDIGGDIPASGSKFAGRYPNSTGVSGTNFGYACGKIFKSPQNLTVDIRNSILRMDSLGVGGASSMNFPSGTYSNVVLVWLGAGSYPGTLPSSGVTVMTGTPGLDFWNAQRTEWLLAHDVPNLDIDTLQPSNFPFLAV